MPLYEYECDTNGHRFEVIQKFSDSPITICPTCGSPVHKLMSSPAIQFKGTGWYITDYAKKDSAAAGKAGGSKDKSSESTTSGGTDKGDTAAKSESTSAPAPAATSSDSGTTKKD